MRIDSKNYIDDFYRKKENSKDPFVILGGQVEMKQIIKKKSSVLIILIIKTLIIVIIIVQPKMCPCPR